MNRITKITLTGFKGLHREYDLGAATVLSGPNGAGKSAALEALIYALTGSTPAGKSEDRVAQYFPARGGRVKIEDAEGNWIERGIIRDFAKAKVSSQVRTSDDAEDATEPDLTRWKVSGAVLDLREFLGLSPEKRREFVLKLCGQGDGGENIWPALELAYAREIGGPCADVKVLLFGEGLPEDVAALGWAWRRELGLSEILSSYVNPRVQLSDTFLKLGEVAKEQRLAAGREAKNAAAAERELEAEAHGARAAAADLAVQRKKVEKLRLEQISYLSALDRRDEALRAIAAAERRRDEAEVAEDKALDAAVNTPQPGPQPPAPEKDPRREVLQAKLIDCQERQGKLRAAKHEASHLQDQRRRAEEDLKRATAAIEAWRKQPMGRLSDMIGEIPIDAHPKIEDLRELIWEVSKTWQETLLQIENDMPPFQRKVEELQKQSAGVGKKLIDIEREWAAEETAEVGMRQELADLKGVEGMSFDGYRKRLAEWEAKDKAFKAATDRCKATAAAAEGAEKAMAEAMARLESLDDGFSLESDVDARLQKALLDQEQAEKAAGALQAYDSASARARQAQVDQAAWGHAEKAIQSVRERLVGAATAGLLTDLNAVLQAAGREEIVYLELENDRGKPIFELGWSRGGQRTALPALSAGEAVIFCAALSIALAKRSPGRRMLLVEADPLDLGNLEALLAALTPQAAELEALVVATAAVGWEPPAGWEVRVLAKDVLPARRKKVSA
jgi:DNA repair exonuclease SbcCD ATPase subunit